MRPFAGRASLFAGVIMRLTKWLIALVLAVTGVGAYFLFVGEPPPQDLAPSVSRLLDRVLHPLRQPASETSSPGPVATGAADAAGATAASSPAGEEWRSVRQTCPACKGEGRVAWTPRSASGQVSKTGEGGDGKRVTRMGGEDTRPQYCNCPSCGGAGYRLLKLPPHAFVCPDCGGMGKVPSTTSGRPYGKSCRRCNGTGWIMPREKIM